MKNIYTKILIVFCAVLLLPSCITNKQKLYLQDEGKNKMYDIKPFEQYKLCVNDEIVYYLMTTSSETQYLYNGGGSLNTVGGRSVYRIYEDGCVVLPTIGKVEIADLTVREAEKVITDKFKTIVLDAEVKIALTNNYFYVQGDKGKGQFFMYKENLNIFQAMALTGDISSSGDKKNIKIIRKGIDGVDHIETFDLTKESIIESEYYYVRPNDVIYIPTNSNSFFRSSSISGFISMFVAPLSLLITAIALF